MDRDKDITWSKDLLTVREIAEQYRAQFPLFVIIETNDGSGQNAEDNTSPSQMARIHSVTSQRRILLENEVGQFLTVPENFKSKFDVITEAGKRGRKTVKEVTKKYQLPASVMSDRKTKWPKNYNREIKYQGKMVVIATYTEKFLRFNLIKKDGISQSVTILPFYSQYTMRAFVGPNSPQAGAAWNTRKDLYKRALSNVQYDGYRPPDVLTMSADQLKQRMKEDVYSTLITARNMKQEYVIGKKVGRKQENSIANKGASITPGAKNDGPREFTLFFDPDDELENARILQDGAEDTMNKTIDRMELSTLERTSRTRASESDDEVFDDNGNKDVSVIRYDTAQAIDRRLSSSSSSSPSSNRSHDAPLINDDSLSREQPNSSFVDLYQPPSRKSSGSSSSPSISSPANNHTSSPHEDSGGSPQYGTVVITQDGEEKEFGRSTIDDESTTSRQEPLHKMKTLEDLSPKALKEAGPHFSNFEPAREITMETTSYSTRTEMKSSVTHQQIDDTASLDSQRTATIICLRESPPETSTLGQSGENSTAVFPMRNANSVSSISREGSVISIPIGHQQGINIAPLHTEFVPVDSTLPITGMVMGQTNGHQVLSQGAPSVSSIEDHTLHIVIQGTDKERAKTTRQEKKTKHSSRPQKQITKPVNDRMQDEHAEPIHSSHPDKQRQEPVDDRFHPNIAPQVQHNPGPYDTRVVHSGTSGSTTPDIVSIMNAKADELQRNNTRPDSSLPGQDRRDLLHERVLYHSDQQDNTSHSQSGSTTPDIVEIMHAKADQLQKARTREHDRSKGQQDRRIHPVDDRIEHGSAHPLHSSQLSSHSDGSCREAGEHFEQEQQRRQHIQPKRQNDGPYPRERHQDETYIQGRIENPGRSRDRNDRRDELVRHVDRSDNYASIPRRHDQYLNGYAPDEHVDKHVDQPTHSGAPRRYVDHILSPDQTRYDSGQERHKERTRPRQPEYFPDQYGVDYIDKAAPRRAVNRTQHSHPDNYQNLDRYSRSNPEDSDIQYHHYGRLHVPYDSRSAQNRQNRYTDDNYSSQLGLPIYDSDEDVRYDQPSRRRSSKVQPRNPRADSGYREDYPLRSPRHLSPFRRENEPVYTSRHRRVGRSPPRPDRSRLPDGRRNPDGSPPRRRRAHSEEWPQKATELKRNRNCDDELRQRRRERRFHDDYDGGTNDYIEVPPRREYNYRVGTSPGRARRSPRDSRDSWEYIDRGDDYALGHHINIEQQYSPERRRGDQRQRRPKQTQSPSRRRYSDDDADYGSESLLSDLSDMAMRGPLIEGIDLFDNYTSDRNAHSSLPRSSRGERNKQTTKKSQFSDTERENSRFAGMSGFNKYSAMLTSNKLSPTSRSAVPIYSVDQDFGFRSSSHQSRDMMRRPIIVQPDHGGSTNFSNPRRHMYQISSEPRYRNRSRFISMQSDQTYPSTSRYEYTLHNFSESPVATANLENLLDKSPNYKEPDNNNLRDIPMRSSTSSDSSSQSGISGIHAVYDLEKRRTDETSQVDSEVFDLTNQREESPTSIAKEHKVTSDSEAVSETITTEQQVYNDQSESYTERRNDSKNDTSLSSIIASSKAEALEELDKMTLGEPQPSGYNHSTSTRSLNVSGHTTDITIQESSTKEECSRQLKSGSVSSLRQIIKTPVSSMRLKDTSQAKEGASTSGSKTRLQDIFIDGSKVTMSSSTATSGGKFVMRFKEGSAF